MISAGREFVAGSVEERSWKFLEVKMAARKTQSRAQGTKAGPWAA